MADAIDRLLRSLEDRFEADLGSDERAAASDLALSLLQDQTLREMAPRGSALVAESPWGCFEVGAIGADFVADREGTTMRRLADVVLVAATAGDPPEHIEGSLLDVLRAEARKEPTLNVQLARNEVNGSLDRVGRDHVVLRSGGRVVILPSAAICSVSYVRAG